MSRFYADEQFPLPVVECLRVLGHDVLTAQEAGNADKGIPDGDVLEFAISQKRIVLTLDRYDFAKLHRNTPEHFGIVVCTNDRNWELFAARINKAVSLRREVKGLLLRVTRPSK
ncbi:MAG: DUF5615 family PIN-like protein [Phormidesmis sp.]